MPKTIDEIRRASYPEAVEVECDHEMRVTQLEQRMTEAERSHLVLELVVDSLQWKVAELHNQANAARLDDLARRVEA